MSAGLRTPGLRAKNARLDPDELLRAFVEPTRLRLLALVAEEETCVCDLVGALGLPQPTVSRHLGVLRRAGLVNARKDGLWMWYSLAAAGSPLHAKLLECLECCRVEVPGLTRMLKRCGDLRSGRDCC